MVSAKRLLPVRIAGRLTLEEFYRTINKEFPPPPPVSCKYNNINGLRALSAIGIAVMHYQANLSVKPCLGWASDVLIPCIVERIHLENFILDENLLFVVTYVAGIGAAVAFSYVVRNMIDYVFLHSGHGRLRREKISKK